ncbi:MAG: hypothetical protein AB7T63_15640 [Planctomycetota bacterium]
MRRRSTPFVPLAGALPVASRRAQGQREVEARRKSGQKTLPVIVEGRHIARSFWGKAWCDNLERQGRSKKAATQGAGPKASATARRATTTARKRRVRRPKQAPVRPRSVPHLRG